MGTCWSRRLPEVRSEGPVSGSGFVEVLDGEMASLRHPNTIELADNTDAIGMAQGSPRVPGP